MRWNSLSLRIEGKGAVGPQDCPRVLDQMPPFGDGKINVQRALARGRPDDAHTFPKEARLMAATLNKAETLQSQAAWVNRPLSMLADAIRKAQSAARPGSGGYCPGDTKISR